MPRQPHLRPSHLPNAVNADAGSSRETGLRQEQQRAKEHGPGSTQDTSAAELPLRQPPWRWLRVRWVRWLVFLSCVAVAAGIAVLRRAQRAVDLTPPVPQPIRHVREFALRDAQGAAHGLDEWSGRKAIVLFTLATDCAAAIAIAPEMERLSRAYGPRGVAFYGLVGDPGARPEDVTRFAAKNGIGFPILLDPEQVVCRQAGLRQAPEAVLLDTDGQALYAGRIAQTAAPGQSSRTRAPGHALQAALDAVLAGEMPAVCTTTATGCPLPAPRPDPQPNHGETTYNRDVAPILWRSCAPCHRPGEVGPFPLLTYRDAAKRADFIRLITESRRMPPWKAEPGHGVFLDSLLLTERELKILADWADAGAPEGDRADLPAPPSFPSGWRLGTPDLVYQVPEPYPVPPDGQDDFRSFVIPLDLERDQEVVAFEFRPGNRRVVHHSKMFLDPSSDSRRRDDADPAPGFASFGSADIRQPAIWEWTPGTVPRFEPEGAGWVLRKGSDLVLFIHYHPSGKPESDQSSVGIYLSKKPLRRLIAGIPLASERIDILPGEKRHLVAASTTLPEDAHAYVVMPHAHYLLREMWLRAARPDGTVQTLLWIKDWDFNWQGHYAFARPVALPKGTRLDLVAYYDNSADNPNNPSRPPRRVRFGPTSNDEMLGCHIEVIPDDPRHYPVFRKRWPSGF